MSRFCSTFLFAFAFASFSLHAQSSASRSGSFGVAGFDVPTAMHTLFGNFNPKAESSSYDVPQTTVLDLKGSSFKIGDKIVIQPLSTLQTTESGQRKVILLTFAVPKESFGRSSDDLKNFECHACTPLIGVAVFVRGEVGWKVESSRTAVARGGGFGDPPTEFRVIVIGPHTKGIEMIDRASGGETTLSRVIMVPWNGKVNLALHYIASDDNHGDCGADADGMPCYANRRRLAFVQGAKRDYYDILLRLSGTDMTDSQQKTVLGWERFAFADGYYTMVKRVGDRTTLERFIAASR